MADLNFPSDRAELDPPQSAGPLQTGDTYSAGGTVWVYDATVGAWGSGTGSAVGDVYLSKVNDDNAAGEITFEGLTTHEAGVSVTGGGIDGEANVVFKAVKDDAQVTPLKISTNDNIGCSINSPGAISLYGSTYRQTGGNPAYRFNIGTGGFNPTSTNQVACFLKTDFGSSQPPVGSTYSHISISSDGAAHQGALNGVYVADLMQGVSNNANTEVYGFHSDVDTDGSKPDVLAYNFYAAGTAPNYFAGSIITDGAIVGFNNLHIGHDGGKIPGVNPSNLVDGCSIYDSGLLAASRDSSGANDYAAIFNRRGNGVLVTLNDQGTRKGSINIDGANIAIIGLAGGPLILDEGADARQVTSTEEITNASAVVQQLQPVKINGTRHGFTATALEPVFAEAVSGTAGETEPIGTLLDWDGTELETEVVEPGELTYTEEVETDGVAQMVTRTRSWTQTGTRDVLQGVDQTKLIPLLTKALQEALSRLEAIEANEVIDDATDSALLTLVANLATRVSALENA